MWDNSPTTEAPATLFEDYLDETMKRMPPTLFSRLLISLVGMSALVTIAGCSSGNSMTTAPTATGIVICEKLESFPSGHFSCIRIHNGYKFPSLPERATFFTFAQIPGTKDGLRFQYKIKDSDGSEIDATPPKWLDGLANPAFSHKVAAEFANVEFKHAGQYDIVLEVNSQPVGKTSLIVEQGSALNQNAAPANPGGGK